MNEDTNLQISTSQPLVIPDVGSSLILYHGTNRRIANLNIESFLTANIKEAVFFAENKGDGMVYQFNVKRDEVYRDTGTPQTEWYLSAKKLKPIRCWSV